MRNEQNYIEACLTALERQTYPNHLFDVFVLNDQSTDASPELVEAFTRRHSNFFQIHITSTLANLKGKMNVLAQGLKQIDHELVLITDADCLVQPTWIESMVRYFGPQVGMVGAFTSLFPFGEINPGPLKNTLFSRVQALDWAYLQTMNAMNSNAKKPVSILGNNFAFRLQAYREVGGFEEIGFSVTEDFALMEAIRRKTNWQIVHTIDRETAIYSHPLPDLKSFFRQRLRWIQGGRTMRPWGYFVVFYSLVTHIALLIYWLLNGSSFAAYLPFVPLFGADLWVLLKPLKRLKLTKLLKDFWAFQMFYFGYLIIFSVLGLLPLKVNWKGRKL